MSSLDRARLETLAVDLLCRQPGLAEDVMAATQAGASALLPAVSTANVGGTAPSWCVCTFCRPMPTEPENVCCRQQDCITGSRNFSVLCRNANVLEISIRDREDILQTPPMRNNEEYRFAAYRQYILWQHGKLGAGRRMVVPACCVLAIRRKFPSADGKYKGFLPAV